MTRQENSAFMVCVQPAERQRFAKSRLDSFSDLAVITAVESHFERVVYCKFTGETSLVKSVLKPKVLL